MPRKPAPKSTPATSAPKKKAYAAAGVGQMITAFLIDVEDRAMLRRSFTLFQEEVMPNVMAVSAAAA